jgi:hypothetical protein
VDEFAYSVWETVMTTSAAPPTTTALDISALKVSNVPQPEDAIGLDLSEPEVAAPEIQPSLLELPNTLHPAAPVASSGFVLEDTTRQRVEEFVRGFLGLSSFDAADVFFSHPTQRQMTQIFTQGSETAPKEFSCFRYASEPRAQRSVEVELPMGRRQQARATLKGGIARAACRPTQKGASECERRETLELPMGRRQQARAMLNGRHERQRRALATNVLLLRSIAR